MLYYNMETIINTPRRKRRSDCRYNDDLQIIDTEYKAYFLGLLFSDGSICRLKGEGSKSYCMRISLAIEDKKLIDDLHLNFPFFFKREQDYKQYSIKNSRQIELKYYGKLLYDDLVNNGMLTRKSYENKELMKIPNLTNDLIHHFVRGFFDGDGSIFIPTSRKNLRRVEICSVSKSFITELNEWFTLQGCKSNGIRERKDNRIQTLYVIEWIKSDVILKLRDLLYKNSNISIDRKKEKFYSFEIVDKTKRGIICKHCENDTTYQLSDRQFKNCVKSKYQCKKCKKVFYLPKALIKSEELLENPKMDNQQPSL